MTCPAEAPFIDTHVHHWDHSVDGLHWPWLEPGFTHRMLRDMHVLDAPRYTAAEFREETTGAGVAGVVHVQAVGEIPDPSDETAWLQRMGDEHGWPTGIVASCTISRPGAVDLLRRHAEHARFCGARDITSSRHLDPDEGAAALDELAALGLSLEARRHPDSFDVLDEIAARWPELTVVMSHACLPLERTPATLRQWTAAAQLLARRPNVVCKISAVAGASQPDWTPAVIRPWINACIDTFGPPRCMFATNWPVERLVTTYQDLVGAYREVTADLTSDERAAVFHGTATRVYRLDPATLTAP